MKYVMLLVCFVGVNARAQIVETLETCTAGVAAEVYTNLTLKGMSESDDIIRGTYEAARVICVLDQKLDAGLDPNAARDVMVRGIMRGKRLAKQNLKTLNQ